MSGFTALMIKSVGIMTCAKGIKTEFGLTRFESLCLFIQARGGGFPLVFLTWESWSL